MKPKVAICIPTFNSSKSILDALNSIPTNVLGEADVFVFDNASTDDTLGRISNFSLFKVKVCVSKFNEGFVRNINRCLSLHVQYQWVCILHSDDVFVGNSLIKALELLEAIENVGIVCSRSLLVKDNQDVPSRLYEPMIDSLRYVVKSQIAPSGIFYSAQAIKACGYYDEKYPYSADEEYHARIAKIFGILEVDCQIALMKIHGTNHRFLTWEKPDFLSNYMKMRCEMATYLGHECTESWKRSEEIKVCYSICIELIKFKKSGLFSTYYIQASKLLRFDLISMKLVLIFFLQYCPWVINIYKNINEKISK